MHHSRPLSSSASSPLREALNIWRRLLAADRGFDLRTFLIIDLIVSLLLLPLVFGVIWLSR